MTDRNSPAFSNFRLDRGQIVESLECPYNIILHLNWLHNYRYYVIVLYWKCTACYTQACLYLMSAAPQRCGGAPCGAAILSWCVDLSARELHRELVDSHNASSIYKISCDENIRCVNLRFPFSETARCGCYGMFVCRGSHPVSHCSNFGWVVTCNATIIMARNK